MYEVTKSVSFDAAHVLDGSYSKECQNIHGHTYEMSMTFSSDHLDENGMVVDFKLIKELIEKIIDSYDHKLIMSEKYFRSNIQGRGLKVGEYVIVKFNPTAENMAKDTFDRIKKYTSVGDNLVSVTIRETPNSFATYRG